MINKDLIDKFYKGECTDAEVQQVLSWFDNQQEGEGHIETLWDHFETEVSSSGYNSHKTLQEIHQRAAITEPKSWSHYRMLQQQWWRVAAILVFAFMLSFLIVEPELPADTYAEAELYITKENPAGHRSVVQLADGSVVHLNAASSITYQRHFDDSTRRIELSGEAFFEVAEDKTKPFIVSAAGVDTRALGTSFNVKAYSHEKQVQVVLASGKVKVSSSVSENNEALYLLPGDGAWFEKGTQTMKKQAADLYTALAWKNELIVFKQASAETVFSTLERWYGVEIRYPESLSESNWSFTGEFKNEKLENVLLSISYVKNFQYQVNDQSIYITP